MIVFMFYHLLNNLLIIDLEIFQTVYYCIFNMIRIM